MKSNGTVRAATRFGALRTGKVESKNPRLTEAKSKRARTGALFHLSQSQSRRRVIWPHHRSQPRQYLARARTGCAQELPRTHEVLQEPRAHFWAPARGWRSRSWCVSPRSSRDRRRFSPPMIEPAPGPAETQDLTIRSPSFSHRSRPRAGCDRCRRVSTHRAARMPFPTPRRLDPTPARKRSGGETSKIFLD